MSKIKMMLSLVAVLPIAGADPFATAPAAMGELSGMLMDSWPHVFIGLTLLSSLYVSMTQCLNQVNTMS